VLAGFHDPVPNAVAHLEGCTIPELWLLASHGPKRCQIVRLRRSELDALFCMSN
jgi:hypothetical protein